MRSRASNELSIIHRYIGAAKMKSCAYTCMRLYPASLPPSPHHSLLFLIQGDFQKKCTFAWTVTNSMIFLEAEKRQRRYACYPNLIPMPSPVGY